MPRSREEIEEDIRLFQKSIESIQILVDFYKDANLNDIKQAIDAREDLQHKEAQLGFAQAELKALAQKEAPVAVKTPPASDVEQLKEQFRIAQKEMRELEQAPKQDAVALAEKQEKLIALSGQLADVELLGLGEKRRTQILEDQFAFLEKEPTRQTLNKNTSEKPKHSTLEKIGIGVMAVFISVFITSICGVLFGAIGGAIGSAIGGPPGWAVGASIGLGLAAAIGIPLGIGCAIAIFSNKNDNSPNARAVYEPLNEHSSAMQNKPEISSNLSPAIPSATVHTAPLSEKTVSIASNSPDDNTANASAKNKSKP